MRKRGQAPKTGTFVDPEDKQMPMFQFKCWELCEAYVEIVADGAGSEWRLAGAMREDDAARLRNRIEHAIKRSIIGWEHINVLPVETSYSTSFWEYRRAEEARSGRGRLVCFLGRLGGTEDSVGRR